MDHAKKLDFVLKMTRHALDSVQHFDAGGTALGGPGQTVNQGAPTSSGLGSTVSDTTHVIDPTNVGQAVNPMTAFSDVGNVASDLYGLTQDNFRASGANLQAGTNASQLNNAYNGAQSALGQQQGLVGQLYGQGVQGVNSQNQLTQQLQNQSQGKGPNPAQAALNQSTGQNINQQAALMAGQRGAGANAGLLASQAAQQGANTQQQAVGQGATLQAQQQLAAQNQLAGLAANQINQQGQAVSGLSSSSQNEQNVLQNSNNAFNTANVGMQSNINNVNGQISQGNQTATNNLLSNIAGGGSSMLSSLFAKGGKVGSMPAHIGKMASLYHHYDDGGEVDLGKPTDTPEAAPAAPNIGSMAAQPAASSSSSSGGGGGGGGAGALSLLALLAKGGNVPNMGAALKGGGGVPGKPKVGHDAYKNDTVDAKLSPGEVVIDLNTLKDKGELGKKARFVAANIARKNAGRKL